MVEHGSDSVEPESVEAVQLDPHLEVGQEESEDLPLRVVEEPRVPQGVVPAGAGVEEPRVLKKKKY